MNGSSKISDFYVYNLIKFDLFIYLAISKFNEKTVSNFLQRK